MSTYMERYFERGGYSNYSSRECLTAQLRQELKNFFIVKSKFYLELEYFFYVSIVVNSETI